MKDYLKAGYSHFFIQTEEPNEAINYIQDSLADCKAPNTDEPMEIKVWGYDPNNVDPLAPLMETYDQKNIILILKNYNWFLFKDILAKTPNPDIVQFILDSLPVYRSPEYRKAMIIVSNNSKEESLPIELLREFKEITYPLPTKKEIESILNDTIETAKESNSKFKKVSNKKKTKLINAAVGMSRIEAQNSFFLSLVKTGKLDSNSIIDQRAEYLKNVAGLHYIKYTESFDNLKGYERYKKFVSKTLPNPKSKGTILIGPTGTGKSHCAKACAGEFEIPMITVEMAEWQSSFVGDNEKLVRKAIEAIKSFERVLLFIDELEKGWSGIGGRGNVTSDSINERAMSQFLKFMQDRKDGIYILATCNDISKIPPEYLRAERWDTAPWFIDLPQTEERKSIFEYYKNLYNVEGKFEKNYTEGWTGSELKTLCRLTSIFNEEPGSKTLKTNDLNEFIVPASVTKNDEIEILRQWAVGKTLSASFNESKSRGYSTKSIKLKDF